MKIEYNESENIIEIKDGLENHYLILKFVMILNIANAVIRLIRQNKMECKEIDYFWIILGITSLVSLYFLIYKKSAAENIKVEQIKRLNEKSVFGRKRFSLELKNGKNRIIGGFKEESELVEMRELFTRIGISNE